MLLLPKGRPNLLLIGPCVMSLDETDEIDEGLILESDAKCYSPPFNDTTHVKPLPQVGLVDITFDLTRRLYGKGYNYLIGEDWQQILQPIRFMHRWVQ